MEKQRKLRVISRRQGETHQYDVCDMETDEKIEGIETVRILCFKNKRPELHIELSSFEFETLTTHEAENTQKEKIIPQEAKVHTNTSQSSNTQKDIE